MNDRLKTCTTSLRAASSIGIPIGKMGWKFIGACFLVMWVDETDSLKPRSNLCRPLQAYTSDCTHQMGLSKVGCSAVIERNNTVCWDMNFPTWSSPTFDGRHFKLRTYCYNDGAYQRTGLNITINAGSWMEAAIRFKIEGMNFVSCVQFAHNASLNDNFVLFYDCIWHKYDLYGKQIKVDYFLKDQNRDTMEFGNFHFILPQCHFNEIGESDLDISRHQTFIYVDEKASSFTTIHIQKMPVDYQINTYIIKKCHTCDNNLNKETECSKAYCTTEEKVNTNIDEEEIALKVPNDSNENCFYLTVEAVCHNCSTSNWCVARSVLLIPSKTVVTALPFIVVPLCFLSVLALSCIYYRKKQRTVDGNSYKHPTVLLVYNPVHDVHVQIIQSIVKLMMYCEIDVLFADVDITKSFEKNPLAWYNSAVLEADYIAIISALSCLNKSISINNKIFQVGMGLVEEAVKNDPSGIRIFNITLPYNLENDVPSITKCQKTFHLMEDYDDMILYVHKIVNGVRAQPLNLKVRKRMKGCKTLPGYLELCQKIEDMENVKKIITQEESACLNTTQDNFAMITFSERSVPAPVNSIAEHISNKANVPTEDSRHDLDHEYQSLQELLQRTEHSTDSSKETIDSDSYSLLNMRDTVRHAFVTSIDKFLYLDGLQ